MGNAKEVKKYVEGKSVIFVGPSIIMKGRSLGDWIDSFDIVIRTNGAGSLVKDTEYVEDYGSKCNILCINNQFMHWADTYNIENLVSEHGLKFVLVKTFKPEYFEEYQKIVSIEGIDNKIQGLSGPFMGNLVFDYVLKLNPESFWITGIDFYNQIEKYCSGYTPSVIKEQIEQRKNNKSSRQHSGYENHMYTYNLIKKGHIKTNDFVLEQLEEKLQRLSNEH